MSRRSMSELKNMFNKEDNSNSNYGDYYPFWQMPVGKQATIRFLPDENEDNPFGFLLEKVTHKLIINGEEKTIPCMSMFGEKCPICDVSQSFYKAKDVEQGKQYWKKKQNLARVLVIEDPLPANDEGETYVGKIVNISLNYSLYQIIKEAFTSDELEEYPDHFDEGTNFIIKKTQQGDYASYTLSKFARRPTALTEDERALVIESQIDLSTLLPGKPDIDDVEAKLEAALNGSEYTDGNSSNQSNSGTSNSNDSGQSNGGTSNGGTSDDDDDDDDDPEAILAALRNRKKKS